LFRSCVPPFVGPSFINFDETIGIIVYFEGTVWKDLLVRNFIGSVSFLLTVGFSMGKGSSFPSWESSRTAIDLILIYLDGPDL
jgi:hypothetical protein